MASKIPTRKDEFSPSSNGRKPEYETGPATLPGGGDLDTMSEAELKRLVIEDQLYTPDAEVWARQDAMSDIWHHVVENEAVWEIASDEAKERLARMAWLLFCQHDSKAAGVDAADYMAILRLGWADPVAKLVIETGMGDAFYSRDRRAALAEVLTRGARRQGGAESARRFRKASELDNAPPVFLWQPHIPRGSYTMLIGDQSVGKTALATWIAGLVTSGRPFPNYSRYPMPEVSSEAGIVAWFDSGENPDGVARRRLEAAGVDLDRVLIADAPRQLKDVDAVRGDLKSLDTPPRLIIFDNLIGMSGGLKLNDAGEVGPVMSEYNRLAAELGAAILILHHVGKAEYSRASDFGSGSKAIQNMARSVMICGAHPEDEEAYVLCHTKASEEATAGQMAYRLERVDLRSGGTSVRFDEVGAVDFPTAWVVYGKPKEKSEGEGGTKFKRCKAWLEDKLTDGPQESTALKRSGIGKGFRERMQQEARAALGMECVPVKGVHVVRYEDEAKSLPRAREDAPPENPHNILKKGDKSGVRMGCGLRTPADDLGGAEAAPPAHGSNSNGNNALPEGYGGAAPQRPYARVPENGDQRIEGGGCQHADTHRRAARFAAFDVPDAGRDDKLLCCRTCGGWQVPGGTWYSAEGVRDSAGDKADLGADPF